MSTDQTGTNGKFEVNDYVYINFNIEDWCSYNGNCEHHSLIIDDAPSCCLLCKHRKLIDIPEVIKKKKLKKRNMKII